MQDLLVSYTRAVIIEALAAGTSNDQLWERSRVRLKETRARLVDAIEKLERDSKMWEAKK